ncbi:MAG: hypothetical protein K2H85_02370 [Allobaculum sp.]|nr:hypothetical protein [Allobaculum sp.]
MEETALITLSLTELAYIVSSHHSFDLRMISLTSNGAEGLDDLIETLRNYSDYAEIVTSIIKESMSDERAAQIDTILQSVLLLFEDVEASIEEAKWA